MSVVLEKKESPGFSFQYKKLAEKVVDCVLDTEEFPFEAEVNLIFTGLEEIHQINMDTRGIDRPTDVLSFPMIPYSYPADYRELKSHTSLYLNPDSEQILLGDIVLCIDKVKAQALEYGHSEKREYAFLIAHSMLHLLGYDHIQEEERIEMETKQNLILNKLKIYR